MNSDWRTWSLYILLFLLLALVTTTMTTAHLDLKYFLGFLLIGGIWIFVCQKILSGLDLLLKKTSSKKLQNQKSIKSLIVLLIQPFYFFILIKIGLLINKNISDFQVRNFITTGVFILLGLQLIQFFIWAVFQEEKKKVV